jgi:hypothetical protein
MLVFCSSALDKKKAVAARKHIRDRIRTCNPLIRSQMLFH